MDSSTPVNWYRGRLIYLFLVLLTVGGLLLMSPTRGVHRPDVDTQVAGTERYTIVRRGNDVLAAYAEQTNGNFDVCYGTFKPKQVSCHHAIPRPTIGGLSWPDGD